MLYKKKLSHISQVPEAQCNDNTARWVMGEEKDRSIPLIYRGAVGYYQKAKVV
jgi:hypothetical protein